MGDPFASLAVTASERLGNVDSFQLDTRPVAGQNFVHRLAAEYLLSRQRKLSRIPDSQESICYLALFVTAFFARVLLVAILLVVFAVVAILCKLLLILSLVLRHMRDEAQKWE